MPRIEPITAPINRRRLARRRRTSKRITATAKIKPAIAPRRCDRLDWRKWYPAATQITVKISRIANMSQKPPTPPVAGVENDIGFSGRFSGLSGTEERVGGLKARVIVAPFMKFRLWIPDKYMYRIRGCHPAL